MTADELLALMESRFTSGNSVPVERAYIKRDEWLVLKAEFERLRVAASWANYD